MAKNTITDWDTAAGNNSDIGGVNIAEGCPPSGINNGMRETMAQIAGGMATGNIMGSGYVTKSGAYTVLQADRGKTIDCSAALTLTLTAAATLGAGWICFVKADGGAVTIDPNGGETIDGQSTLTIADGADAMVICDGSAFHTVLYSKPASLECQGRLTLTSGTSVTTSDVTGAGTVYFTPHNGNVIWLNNGTFWVPFTFSEMSKALSGGTASVPNDIFMNYNSGTPQLEIIAWLSDTARYGSNELIRTDGVWTHETLTTYRYIGTVYLDGSKQCADSYAKRHVWNAYNRVRRPMRVLETTNSWNYTTATIRQANGSAVNQLDMVVGLNEDMVSAQTQVMASNTSASVSPVNGIGLDSTTAFATQCIRAQVAVPSANLAISLVSSFNDYVGIGRHTLTWLEESHAIGTTTWFGDNGLLLTQSGIHGSILA